MGRSRRAVPERAGLAAVVGLMVSSGMAAPAAAVSDSGGAIAVNPSVVVDAANPKFPLSPAMAGVNNNKWRHDSQGLWDDDADEPVADATAKMERAGLGLIRFPGGTSSNLFDWRRAVGPRHQRACQISGSKPNSGDLVGISDNDYGPSEHMELVEAAGSRAQIMVPFVNESPADAANWVEYMNAPVGTNPNGGVAWAEVRQADGSTAPYHVTRWEIGNEQNHGGHQGYWMAADDTRRLEQYIEGAQIRFTDQPMGRECDFDKRASNGAANQTFYLRYGLIKPGAWPTITVGGVTWNRVDDLASAGPNAHVYELDRGSGAVSFGDGTHGTIPVSGRRVKATYTFLHRGFVAMYDAMKDVAKQIGTDIDVCATWAPVSKRVQGGTPNGAPGFPGAMAFRGFADRYDCVAMHPYTSFNRDFGDTWNGPVEAHHEHMLGDRWARAMVLDLQDRVNAHTTPGPDGRKAYVAISELGALWFNGPAGSVNVPEYSATMTHALYMTSQWIRHARFRVRWAEGNALVGGRSGLRGMLGGINTGFVYSAEAMTREAIKHFFANGSRWTGSRVDNQQFVHPPQGGKWPVLVVGASTGADGKLRVVVVNRGISSSETVSIVPNGFAHRATVEVTTVKGNNISSYNDDVSGGGDDTVRITATSSQKSTGTFTHTFPKASVTVLTLTPL